MPGEQGEKTWLPQVYADAPDELLRRLSVTLGWSEDVYSYVEMVRGHTLGDAWLDRRRTACRTGG